MVAEEVGLHFRNINELYSMSDSELILIDIFLKNRMILFVVKKNVQENQKRK
jgi:hypothetical protein